MSSIDRTLLLAMGFLAAYQIAIGIDRMDSVSIVAYTVAFGVLLVAGLLLIILGFEVLDAPIVVIISTIIPLSLSLGLVWQHLASFRTPYLIFVISGFVAVVLTRLIDMKGKIPLLVVAITHGVSGMIIFLLPIFVVFQGQVKFLFALVGLGGAFIGIGGLFLSFMKSGTPLISKENVLKTFSALLFISTLCFVIGFKFG
ncbi:MAG: hypothetical protein U0Z26_06405 [Anaerolineales bacterium]